MSESWLETKASIQRLKNGWRDADEDARYRLGFWAAGIFSMGVAIVAQFGWLGGLFCAGVTLWWSSSAEPER